MSASANIYAPSPADGPLRQGEIISNLSLGLLNLNALQQGNYLVDVVTHPYALIVSQDCDLEWDYRARQGEAKQHRTIPHVLLCEVETAEALRNGEGMNAGLWKQIQANKDERYHFLQLVRAEQDRIGTGLPELAVDFKRYFSLAVAELYYRVSQDTRRRCVLTSPYLEHFCTRFFYFQSRVALPGDHFSEPGR